MMTEVDTYTRLVPVTCCKCGIPFGMPIEYRDRRMRDQKFWFCPNGHEQHYTGPTELERVKAEAARMQARNDQLQAELKTQRSRTTKVRNQLSATKGVVTRLKNRAKNGVCPCCNRTFQQLARHMATKHPDFTAAEE